MLSSILLLNNVIPGFKENIAEEMQKNNIILLNLFNVIKILPTIPGAIHNPKVRHIY